MNTVDELRIQLAREHHATTLVERVGFVGGTPAATVPAIPVTDGSRQARRHDLELEQHQLDRYTQRMEQANQLWPADVAEALRPLLTQTRDHVRELRGALGI